MVQAPTIDLSNVQESLEGKWVVLRVSDHAALGHGDSPGEALAEAGVGTEDAGILLARIPLTRVPMIA
jgi:hypothetical protein